MDLEDLTIIIPAYNEAQGIGVTLRELCEHRALAQTEIIVVNDGSSDGTVQQVRNFPTVRLLNHAYNRGYGTAIKTATRAATREYVCWYDADGQHRVSDLVTVCSRLISQNLDYCIGVRTEDSYQVRNRTFGKMLLRWTIQWVARQPIRDFNSGLRGFRRDILLRYLHLLPSGFSASTTTTLLMLERGHLGDEVSIVVRERIGESSVRQFRDGMRTLRLILRLLLLFSPFRFFGNIGAALIMLGAVYGFYEAITVRTGFPVFAALVMILGVQSLFFGILSDQISEMRRERFDVYEHSKVSALHHEESHH